MERSDDPQDERVARWSAAREQLAGTTATPRSWWGTTAIGATAIVLTLIWLLARPLALLFAAIVIAEALTPVVNWLERRMRRTVEVILLYLALLLVVVLVSWLMVPPLIDQAQRIAIQAPVLIGRLQDVLNQFLPLSGARLAQMIASQLSRLASFLVALPFTILSDALQIVFVVFLSLYWLLTAPSLRRFFLSLCPDNDREKADMVLREWAVRWAASSAAS